MLKHGNKFSLENMIYLHNKIYIILEFCSLNKSLQHLMIKAEILYGLKGFIQHCLVYFFPKK